MKLVVVTLAAAALASACASTTPSTQVADNSCSLRSLEAGAMADLHSGHVVGQSTKSTCAAPTGIDRSPAALHAYVNGKTRARTSADHN